MKKPSSVNPATRQRKSHRQDAPAELVRGAEEAAKKARILKDEKTKSRRIATASESAIPAGRAGSERRGSKAADRNERRRLGGVLGKSPVEVGGKKGVAEAATSVEGMLKFPLNPTLEQRIHSWLDVLIHVWRKRSQGKTKFVRNARLSDGELAQVGAGVQRLSRGFTGHRRLVGSTYLADPELLGAYLLFYWPVSYAQTWTILADQERVHGPLNLKRFADLGSGPGPLACALFDASPHDDKGCPQSTAYALDHVPQALDLFREICETAWGSSFVQSGRCVTRAFNAQDDFEVPENLDCVTFGHVLNELWNEAPAKATGRRIALIKKAQSSLRKPSSEGKKELPPFVLILEPALKPTTRALLEIRDILNNEGQRILGPCFYRGACPALATVDGTCHGQVFWEVPSLIRRLAGVAKVSKDEIAMAWLSVAPKSPAIDGRKVQTNASPDNQAVATSTGPYRVVSEAMVNKAGRTRYMICGPAGRFSFSALLPIDPPKGPIRDFGQLRRGDALKIHDPEIREAGWGVTEKTGLEGL